MRTFPVVVERDAATHCLVGSVPGWPAAHSQGRTQEELDEHLREVIAMLLEGGEPQFESEFVGLSTIEVE